MTPRPAPRRLPLSDTSSSSQKSVPEGIVVDWKAYFLEFCRVHGEPVEYRGQLIFADGWSYSSTDYEGPEYPPSNDSNTLDTMVVSYWMIRRDRAIVILHKLTSDMQRFKDLQAIKSLPVQQRVAVEDRNGKTQITYKPLNLAPIEERIRWLREDVREAEKRLREIEEYHNSLKSA